MTQYWTPIIHENVKRLVTQHFQPRHRAQAGWIIMELLARIDRTSTDGKEGSLWVSRRELSKTTNCPESVVRLTLNKLQTIGELTHEPTHRATRVRFTHQNLYIYSRPPTDPQTDSEQTPDSPQTDSEQSPNQPTNSPETKEIDQKREEEESPPDKLLNSHFQTLVDHWNGYSGADSKIIPQERVDPKVRGSAAAATDRGYDFDTLIRAITNYAEILDEPTMRWTHAWTLSEFLDKGVDRFRDDADPFENWKAFNTKSPGNEYGGLMPGEA